MPFLSVPTTALLTVVLEARLTLSPALEVKSAAAVDAWHRHPLPAEPTGDELCKCGVALRQGGRWAYAAKATRPWR